MVIESNSDWHSSHFHSDLLNHDAFLRKKHFHARPTKYCYKANVINESSNAISSFCQIYCSRMEKMWQDIPHTLQEYGARCHNYCIVKWVTMKLWQLTMYSVDALNARKANSYPEQVIIAPTLISIQGYEVYIPSTIIPHFYHLFPNMVSVFISVSSRKPKKLLDCCCGIFDHTVWRCLYPSLPASGTFWLV